ncbi:unnamed protein product [Acanthoscelides obtectus]|nr:unnamed protein product [Acanthoscelides obtectus]
MTAKCRRPCALCMQCFYPVFCYFPATADESQQTQFFLKVRSVIFLDRASVTEKVNNFCRVYTLKKSNYVNLFDEASERYMKIKKNLEHVIPVQVGLTTFSFNADSGSYLGTVYNFFIIPASFPTLQNVFCFQSGTLEFLRLHGFDFNKLMYQGIPYMNSAQEAELRRKLLNNEITEVLSSFKPELETVFDNECEAIKKWYHNAKEGDHLSLEKIYDKYKNNIDVLYFVQKGLRAKFKNTWTSIDSKEFVLKKVTSEELKLLKTERSLEEEQLDELLGFTKLFRLITNSRKPLVGHNLLLDIALMINSFECPLPASYNKFKKLTNTLFPAIYDTKVLCYEMKNLIPEEKRWNDKGLQSIFEYFKDGVGRHVVLNSPAIEMDHEGEYGKYHEAGWDSFCAGYVFIRLAYLNVYDKFPKSKKFVSAELIGGLSEWKNRVNVIRASISSIKLDGEDPKSTRPPFLVVEFTKNVPVDLNKVTAALSSFGFIEVKKLPYQNRRAIVAVDNFGNARRILNNFKSHNEIRVQHYNALKHSSVIRAFILGGLALSGTVMFMMMRSVIKR